MYTPFSVDNTLVTTHKSVRKKKCTHWVCSTCRDTWLDLNLFIVHSLLHHRRMMLSYPTWNWLNLLPVSLSGAFSCPKCLKFCIIFVLVDPNRNHGFHYCDKKYGQSISSVRHAYEPSLIFRFVKRYYLMHIFKNYFFTI